jgi:hypothetical protein
VSWFYLLLLLTALLGGVCLTVWFLRWRRSRFQQRAWRRAKAAEDEAVSLLEEAGFKILARQPLRRVNIMVDGKVVGFEIRPDFLLKKGKRLYVGEVKSGKETAFLFRPSIRRQLLEYFVAYRPYGVILVDGEQREIHQVFFPELALRSSRWKGFWVLVLGVFLGVLLGRWVGGT